MRCRWTTWAAAAVGLILAMASGNPAQAKLIDPDRGFITSALSGGVFEIQSSQLAKTKTSRRDVQGFAAAAIATHAKANDQLQSIAQRAGFRIPTQMDQSGQQALQQLAAKQDDAFVKAYLDDQKANLASMIAVFQRESQWARNADIKQFAGQMLAVLQQESAAANRIPPPAPKPAALAKP